MPQPAVDCHAHVFDTARFPYAADAAYKPPPPEVGNVNQYQAVLDAHGISHGLLVNPTSGYGTDHGCMLAAIKAGGGRFKGIARLTPTTDAKSFVRMAGQGVIGARIDLVGDGVGVVGHPGLPRLFAVMRELGWLLQVQCEKEQMAQAAPILRATGLHMLIDHCGRPDPAAGIRQKGFQAVLAEAVGQRPHLAVGMAAVGEHRPLDRVPQFHTPGVVQVEDRQSLGAAAVGQNFMEEPRLGGKIRLFGLMVTKMVAR